MPQRIENSNVKLLIHGDGLVDDYVIKDQCGNTLTTSGVAYSNVRSKFGRGSMLFSSGSISVTNSALNAIKQLDVWAYRVGAWSATPCLIKGTENTNGIIYYDSTTVTYYAPGTANKGNWGTPSVDAWHRYTLICDGTNATTYLDGTQVTQVAYTGNIFDTTTVVIGTHSTLYWVGNMEQIMLSSDITIPTAEKTHRGRKGWY
jgi:hypothetical protein